MVNFAQASVKVGKTTITKEEDYHERFNRAFMSEKSSFTQRRNTNNLIKVSMIISIVLMLILSIFFLKQGHITHIPPGNQKAEEYYDPQLVLKDAKISPATTEKNFALIDFDPCKDYRPELIQAGFDLSQLYMGFPEPNEQNINLHTEVAGNPGVYAETDHVCSWMIKDGTPNFSFITLQEETYTKPPHSSERRVFLNRINGPDNPPKPGFAAVYQIARYEIKGYVAFIKSEYDLKMHKRVCTLSFWPYLDIGATGPNCDKVKKFVSMILP